MKLRRFLLGFVLLSLLASVGCSKAPEQKPSGVIQKGTVVAGDRVDLLYEQAKEEFDALLKQHKQDEPADVWLLGSEAGGSDTVEMWYMTDSVKKGRNYLMMQYRVQEDGSYEFLRSYDPVLPADRIAIAVGENAYWLVIDNENCRRLEVVWPDGRVESFDIKVEEHPFFHEVPGEPKTCRFYDKNGNRISH